MKPVRFKITERIKKPFWSLTTDSVFSELRSWFVYIYFPTEIYNRLLDGSL